MSTPNDGGAAFPNIVHGAIADYQVCEGGMSKREWFAGQALSGLLADPTAKGTPEAFAGDAVRFADAMLVELAKERKP